MNEDIWKQIVVLLILLLLSGFFSSAETSLVAVSKIKIRSMAESGVKRAQTLMKIFENDAKMLSAILIGNNLVNTYAASIASMIALSFGGSAAVSVATFIITFLILVFGEITPKTIATQNAEKLALAYGPVILFLMRILTPVIWFINLFSACILKILGVGKDSRPSMTESELRTIVDVSHEEGVIEEDEKEMINNVFDLGDAVAKDVMVPRVYVVMADVESSYDDLIRLFREEQFTRIPIYEGNVDNIIGLINMKDLLLYEDLEHFDIRKILRKPYFTVENKNVSDLLMEMKQSTFNLAIVLDEYGEVAGIVTVEDIVEEIVGEVQDEYDAHEMENIQKIDDHTYDIKGFINLHDLNDELHLHLDSEDFDSIGGLIIDRLGRLPQLNDQVTLENGIILQVKKIDKNRIEEVRLILPVCAEDAEIVETEKAKK
ncbi:HlyC/CorC family transporter [uncultured Dubosiella sp.]|uniref:HlyC/CorC family transporter n=3 Tax=Dubosiella TaxID=1937008 RepID=A0AC61R7I3_9FIRM|nr:hemolysin family protein [uncultured Dubosiella sp.]TGY65934.1 HlyC/CorC family transporter [Dubosiella muris]